jgi:hypothetical protein
MAWLGDAVLEGKTKNFYRNGWRLKMTSVSGLRSHCFHKNAHWTPGILSVPRCILSKGHARIRTTPSTSCTSYTLSGLVAGGSITAPVAMSKREPWH